MIKYDGMKAEESKREGYGQLPAGAYVAGIKDVKIDGEVPDQSLVLRLDIIEGEYTAYFTKRYQHDSQNDTYRFQAKYKGDFRLRIPHSQSSSQYPETDKRRFNDMIFRVQSSNPGFIFDGDETKLKGKVVGISMQEDEYNGSKFTRIARFETADDVRKGNVKVMSPRKRQEDTQAPAAPAAPAGFTTVETDELPF